MAVTEPLVGTPTSGVGGRGGKGGGWGVGERGGGEGWEERGGGGGKGGGRVKGSAVDEVYTLILIYKHTHLKKYNFQTEFNVILIMNILKTLIAIQEYSLQR